MEVLLRTLTPVAAIPPTVAVAPVMKPLPVIVIAVPPAVGPDAGDTPVTAGGEMYANALVSAPLCESGLVTDTVTVPGA